MQRIAAGLGVYNTFRPQGQYQPNPADQAQADYYRSLIPNQQGGAGTSASRHSIIRMVRQSATTFASNPQQGYPQQGYTGTYA
jgi:hypothetical protein